MPEGIYAGKQSHKSWLTCRLDPRCLRRCNLLLIACHPEHQFAIPGGRIVDIEVKTTIGQPESDIGAGGILGDMRVLRGRCPGATGAKRSNRVAVLKHCHCPGAGAAHVDRARGLTTSHQCAAVDLYSNRRVQSAPTDMQASTLTYYFYACRKHTHYRDESNYTDHNDSQSNKTKKNAPTVEHGCCPCCPIYTKSQSSPRYTVINTRSKMRTA